MTHMLFFSRLALYLLVAALPALHPAVSVPYDRVGITAWFVLLPVEMLIAFYLAPPRTRTRTWLLLAAVAPGPVRAAAGRPRAGLPGVRGRGGGRLPADRAGVPHGRLGPGRGRPGALRPGLRGLPPAQLLPGIGGHRPAGQRGDPDAADPAALRLPAARRGAVPGRLPAPPGGRPPRAGGAGPVPAGGRAGLPGGLLPAAAGLREPQHRAQPPGQGPQAPAHPAGRGEPRLGRGQPALPHRGAGRWRGRPAAREGRRGRAQRPGRPARRPVGQRHGQRRRGRRGAEAVRGDGRGQPPGAGVRRGCLPGGLRPGARFPALAGRAAQRAGLAALPGNLARPLPAAGRAAPPGGHLLPLHPARPLPGLPPGHHRADGAVRRVLPLRVLLPGGLRHEPGRARAVGGGPRTEPLRAGGHGAVPAPARGAGGPGHPARTARRIPGR